MKDGRDSVLLFILEDCPEKFLAPVSDGTRNNNLNKKV